MMQAELVGGARCGEVHVVQEAAREFVTVEVTGRLTADEPAEGDAVYVEVVYERTRACPKHLHRTRFVLRPLIAKGIR